jgi:hypothetical protein
MSYGYHVVITDWEIKKYEISVFFSGITLILTFMKIERGTHVQTA